jgi:hypothetical protein
VDGSTEPAAALRAAAERLGHRVGHWSPGRWAAPAAGEGGRLTRAELVRRLIQQLADQAADLEGRRHHPVPRLDHDLALFDQVRVMVADLIAAANPPADLDPPTSSPAQASQRLRLAAAMIEATIDALS